MRGNACHRMSTSRQRGRACAGRAARPPPPKGSTSTDSEMDEWPSTGTWSTSSASCSSSACCLHGIRPPEPVGTEMSRWGEDGRRPVPDASNRELFARTVGCATTEIACPVADAWALVADVTRIGEFRPECVGARWIGPDRGAHVGARFEGTTRARTATGELIWVRPCTIMVADPGRSFGFVVGDRFDGNRRPTGSMSSPRQLPTPAASLLRSATCLTV